MPRSGDPLADYPQLAEVITDRIPAWREQSLCLCGCGQAVTPPRKSGEKPFYFKRGHIWTVYKQAGIESNFVNRKAGRHPGDYARRERETVTTLGLAGELDQYLRENGLTCVDFGRMHGMDKNYLASIRSRRRKRVMKTSMIKIMFAMGKEVHPSYLDGKRARSCAWCGETFVAHMHAKTCSDNCRRAKNKWDHEGGRSAGDHELAREYGV